MRKVNKLKHEQNSVKKRTKESNNSQFSQKIQRKSTCFRIFFFKSITNPIFKTHL